jgi:nitrite reductase/ring-hydroxylating ferredoxin subunit
MGNEIRVCPEAELTPGTVKGAGSYAVGNAAGQRFAVTRRCRHLRADLAGGSIDEHGCLVCPWHGARYDVQSGKMVSGPGGIFAKIPGFGFMNKLLTEVLPLGRGTVTDRAGDIYVR